MQIRDLLRRAPVIPVLVIERVEDAVPLGRALVEGGLPVLEVTLRTPVALDAIRALSAVDGAIVGAGTVLTAEDRRRAGDAGALFAVSPGLTEALVRADGPLLLPGVFTPSDLMRGMDLGLDTFKFFPAVPAGGPAALKALAGPFPHARFCPTGGIGQENAPSFLALSNVLCVGGAWPAPEDAVRSGDWGAVRDAAARAAALRPA